MARKKILTHRKVQIRLATVFLFCFVIYGAASLALYFLSYQQTAKKIESLQMPDEWKVKSFVIEQSEKLAVGYVLVSFVYLFAVGGFMLAYSHRLTGPIYKLEKILDEAIESKAWPQEIKFRKTDAYPELANKLNTCFQILKNRS